MSDEETDNGELQPNDGLTNLQREGARLAAEGWRGVDIASELQVAPETVSRWRKLPAYSQAVLQHHEAASLATRARLAELIEQSLDTLEELMGYRYDRRIQLRAATALLQLAGVNRIMRQASRDDGGPYCCGSL